MAAISSLSTIFSSINLNGNWEDITLGTGLNDVYLILKHILFKKYKLDIGVKSLDDFDKPNIGYVFPLNIEYGNKVIDLKNNSKILKFVLFIFCEWKFLNKLAYYYISLVSFLI